jgi:hypothetical protein
MAASARLAVMAKRKSPTLGLNRILVVLPVTAHFTDRPQKKTAKLALLICIWVILVAANEAPRK